MASLTSSGSRFQAIDKLLSEELRKVAAEEGRKEMVVSNLSNLEDQLKGLEKRVEDYKLIETFLAQFADERQAKVYRQIEATVSEGLRHVFGEDMRLEISTKMVGSRSEAVFNIVSKGPDEAEMTTSIMDARGGGVASIVGFLIQAVLVLLTPGLQPVIFSDEGFRAVSEEYQSPLGEFIQDLCSKTGLQVVLVTHQPTIAEYADVHYAVSQTKGSTKIARVR